MVNCKSIKPLIKIKYLGKNNTPTSQWFPYSWCLTAELGCSSNPSVLQENPQAHDTSPLFFWVSHQECRSQSNCFSFLPARLQNCFLYRLGCKRVYLPRITPQGVVFLICSWWGLGGRQTQHPPTPPSWSPSKERILIPNEGWCPWFWSAYLRGCSKNFSMPGMPSEVGTASQVPHHKNSCKGHKLLSGSLYEGSQSRLLKSTTLC